MKQRLLEILRCPSCRGELQPRGEHGEGDAPISGRLGCACGREFPFNNGVLDMTFPTRLRDSDAQVRRRYDDSARRYEIGLEWLFASFGEDADAVRGDMVDLLELEAGSCVLDVGCGTGEDSVHIARRLNASGRLVMLDLSRKMLERSRAKLTRCRADLHWLLGNGCYLPFADRSFDAVFHFGGINEFSEPRRAIKEMDRVTRIGGKVVIGDEGVAPWLRRKTYGRILRTANPLYRHQPPLACLPASARQVRVRWILGNAFYVIDYRVGKEPPYVDLDLPIPGRGDSLRSRFFGAGS